MAEGWPHPSPRSRRHHGPAVTTVPAVIAAPACPQTAFAALKHTHEKVGDHWEPKDEYGPSDARAASANPRDSTAPTAGGVDANASKAHLYELATRLKVKGRSTMTKAELVDALQKANDRASAQARS